MTQFAESRQRHLEKVALISSHPWEMAHERADMNFPKTSMVRESVRSEREQLAKYCLDAPDWMHSGGRGFCKRGSAW